MNDKFGLGNVYDLELQDEGGESDDECIFLTLISPGEYDPGKPFIGLTIEDAQTLGCQLIALSAEMQSRM